LRRETEIFAVSKYCGSGQKRIVVPVFELAAFPAAGKTHVVFLAAAANPDFEVFGQRVDDRDADAVQTARILVALVIKFGASVQARQDQLDAGNFFFRMFIDRHAPTVVDDFERPILEQGHLNFLAMTSQRFVDTVVDDFMGEMIRPSRIGVHTGPAPYRLQPAQDFDVRSVVAFSHLSNCQRLPCEARQDSSLNATTMH